MQLESHAFQDNQAIPARYTCDGEDVSPPFKISDVPEGTQSLVLINDDPDAVDGTWVHWTLWNIPADTREIVEGRVPPGAVEGMTSWGSTGFRGSCPPSGTHRYFFKLYALDARLDLPPETQAAQLEEAMVEHVLAVAELIGLYERVK